MNTTSSADRGGDGGGGGGGGGGGDRGTVQPRRGTSGGGGAHFSVEACTSQEDDRWKEVGRASHKKQDGKDSAVVVVGFLYQLESDGWVTNSRVTNSRVTDSWVTNYKALGRVYSCRDVVPLRYCSTPE